MLPQPHRILTWSTHSFSLMYQATFNTLPSPRLFALTPSFTTLTQGTYCPFSPSQVPRPSLLPHHPPLGFAYPRLCVRLHLTPPGTVHQGWAPKGRRAREVPQGLELTFDLCVPSGCLHDERCTTGTMPALYHSSNKFTSNYESFSKWTPTPSANIVLLNVVCMRSALNLKRKHDLI